MKTPFKIEVQILALINAQKFTDPGTRCQAFENFFREVEHASFPEHVNSKFMSMEVSGPVSINGKNYGINGEALIRDFAYFDRLSCATLLFTLQKQGDTYTVLHFEYWLFQSA